MSTMVTNWIKYTMGSKEGSHKVVSHAQGTFEMQANLLNDTFDGVYIFTKSVGLTTFHRKKLIPKHIYKKVKNKIIVVAQINLNLEFPSYW